MTVTPRWHDAVLVIAELELRQRIRATRWRTSLVVVFAVLSLAVLGSRYLVFNFGGPTEGWSDNLYSMVMGLLLFLGIIISPSLSATSINGDRRDATLATVQATPISQWQLAAGKLLGAWAASMMLMVVAAPYLLWGMLTAPEGFARCLFGIVVAAVIFACYCGIGLGFSALTARPAGSAIMTQGAVLFLLLGLPALFGILIPSVTQHQTVIETTGRYADNCREVERDTSVMHTERTWWLLAPNPVLIVADAAAAPATAGLDGDNTTAVGFFATAQSAARAGQFVEDHSCDRISRQQQLAEYYDRKEAHYAGNVGHSWYLGLAVNLLLGGAGFWLAARRLQVPTVTLPRGVRIA